MESYTAKSFISIMMIIIIILLLFLCRRKSGTKDWVQCNSTPVKVCKLPVHGLTEGDSYHFRVRAVNSAGISLPSRMSTGLIAADVESDVEGRAWVSQQYAYD